MNVRPAVLAGCAALLLEGTASAATRPVKIVVDYDAEVGMCAVVDVKPMILKKVDLGDRIMWNVKTAPQRCKGQEVSVTRFRLKGSAEETGEERDTEKDPFPGCKKESTTGGKDIDCVISNASPGDVFKYDVDLSEGKGLDPEIQIRR
jgi:hypothetical protein